MNEAKAKKKDKKEKKKNVHNVERQGGILPYDGFYSRRDFIVVRVVR